MKPGWFLTMMNKEQFDEWKSLSATILIFKQIEALKEVLTVDLASGATIGLTADQIAINTARIVGNIEGLNQILNISFLEEREEYAE